MEELKKFIGKKAVSTDEITAAPIALLAATFGIDAPASKPGVPWPLRRTREPALTPGGILASILWPSSHCSMRVAP